jgi:ABC-2 type transport system ATP-binding protein
MSTNKGNGNHGPETTPEATPEATPAVELADITKRYRTGAALDGVSLTIPRGTTLGLIGPNGAGKSTVIRILMGMLRPDAGVVRVLGIDVQTHAPALRRRVGYVPERHDIYPWMTVAEVIGFTRRFYDTWDPGFCDEMLDMFELDARKRVKQLSKGMLVKLGLLLAVSHRPELLVLDEPTSGLDPIAHEDFLDGIVKAMGHARTSVLYSSHNLADVRRMADSVCMLRRGKVICRGGIDELLASSKRVRAVLADGHLPRWVPAGTVWQRVQRREWVLTVSDFGDDVAERIRSENPVDSVEVCDVTLGELFRDYVKGGGRAQ